MSSTRALLMRGKKVGSTIKGWLGSLRQPSWAAIFQSSARRGCARSSPRLLCAFQILRASELVELVEVEEGDER